MSLIKVHATELQQVLNTLEINNKTMAKASGSTRASKWRSSFNLERLYYKNGKCVEYAELDDAAKKQVKEEKKIIVKAMLCKLRDTPTEQVIDNNQRIVIRYTKRGIDHVAKDAMLMLSGKYFSRKSMLKINEILAKSSYVPTLHGLSHFRDDGRNLRFSYIDGDGRGIYFKVCKNALGSYELYSVTDKK